MIHSRTEFRSKATSADFLFFKPDISERKFNSSSHDKRTKFPFPANTIINGLSLLSDMVFIGVMIGKFLLAYRTNTCLVNLKRQHAFLFREAFRQNVSQARAITGFNRFLKKYFDPKKRKMPIKEYRRQVFQIVFPRSFRNNNKVP